MIRKVNAFFLAIPLFAMFQPQATEFKAQADRLQGQIDDLQQQIDRQHAHLLINTNAALVATTVIASLSQLHTVKERQVLVTDLVQLRAWTELMIAVTAVEKRALDERRTAAMQEILNQANEEVEKTKAAGK